MIRQLLDRRVPQFVGLYLAGTWGFLEFFDWAVDRYLLSPTLIDFALALLLLLLPAVVAIAWRHGTPGPDEWKRQDAAMIGVNALVAAVVLFFAFRGADLGATTTVKLVEDTEGNMVERTVPKAGFRRSVLIYDFENETGDPGQDWLEFGLSFAVNLDLSQDLFLTTLSPDDGSVREWLAERGVAPDQDVPLSLKRDAAELRGMGHFLAGSIRPGDGTPVIETHLYRTSTGREIVSHEYELTDPRRVADAVSLDLRRDLEIPEGQIEESVDLPVGELLTESAEAFELIARGQHTLLRGNDPARAGDLGRRALAIDSTAAWAHLVVANSELFVGNQAEAGAAVDAALKYDYRFPERVRLGVQVQNAYLFDGDLEAAARAGHYWAEIYPQDIEARRLLANILAGSGDREGQIQQLRALLAIDSTDVTARRQLASAFAVEARYDSAIAYAENLRDRQPGDLDVRLQLASILDAAGRYDAARDELEEAAVVAPRDPDVPRQLARMDIREGDVAKAEQRLADAEALERTPVERANRIGLEETLYYVRGQFGRLEDAYRRRLAALREFQNQIQLLQSIDNSEFLMYAYEAGETEAALAQIDSLNRGVQAPWNALLESAAIRNHLAIGDLEAARASLAASRELDALIQSDARRGFLAWIEGRIAELEDGDCRRAAGLYDQALDLSERSVTVRLTHLRCSTEQARWDAAGEDAEWFLEHQPGLPAHRLAVARYLAARGRRDEAIEHLDYALEVWSEADAAYLPAQEARTLRESLRGA